MKKKDAEKLVRRGKSVGMRFPRWRSGLYLRAHSGGKTTHIICPRCGKYCNYPLELGDDKDGFVPCDADVFQSFPEEGWEVGPVLSAPVIATRIFNDYGKLNHSSDEYFYIKEILNDLHRNGFVPGGKAHAMLNDWCDEFSKTKNFPKSQQRRIHAKLYGKENW